MNPFQRFTALRYRNFRLFWIGQMISLTGTWMHATAQNWLVYKLTDSPFYLGLVGAAASAPILLFTLAGGILADRLPKRKIILATQVALMFLALALALMVAGGIITVWHVIAVAFCVGTIHAFEIPSRQSFIIEMVGKESLLNAIALNSSVFHGSRMLGPAIAGVFIKYLGVTGCFLINSLSYLAAIIGLLKMRFDHDEFKKSERHGLTKEFKQGLKYIYNEPEAYVITISVGIISFFGFPYITFLPVYAKDILQTGPAGLGILMGFAGAGAFTGAISLALREDLPNKGFLLALSGIIFSGALIVFSISTITWLSYSMLFLVGFGALNNIATANSLLQIKVPDELRGRVMGFFTTMFLGMSTLGNLTIGSLAHYIGTTNALTTGASLCLLGTLLVIWKNPETYKDFHRKVSEV